jgi:molybdopterin molybdotransferase
MLTVVSLHEMISLYSRHFSPLETEEILPLDQICGRLISQTVCSPEPVPHYRRSTVDGYALLSSDTAGASQSVPAILKRCGSVLMGRTPGFRVDSGECAEVPTGGEIPEGADSVVMAEYTRILGRDEILIEKPVSRGENMILPGDDIKQNEVLLKKGVRIAPVHIGVLAAAGITEVRVRKKLRVTLISTGDELIPCHEKPVSSRIRNQNSPVLKQMLILAGCEVHDLGILKDDLTLIRDAVIQAVSGSDLILLSGGSSAGEKDLTVKVIESIDPDGVLVHGLNLKPGKPTILGKLSGKPVVGLPGNPGAMFTVFHLAVKPLIRHLCQAVLILQHSGTGILESSIPSNHGREEIVPVFLIGEMSPHRIVPIYMRSSNLLPLSRSQAYIRIPASREGYQSGDSVNFYYWDGE